MAVRTEPVEVQFLEVPLSQNVGRVSVFCVTRQALRSNTMRLLMCAYGTAGGLRRKQRASPTHRIKLRLSKCHSGLIQISGAENGVRSLAHRARMTLLILV